MISVVWCARRRSFSVWLLNASVIIRVTTSGMLRGSGALDGHRLTTYMVLSGSGLSSRAPITLDSGVLSNRPPSQYGIGRPPGDGPAVLGKLGASPPLPPTRAGDRWLA